MSAIIAFKHRVTGKVYSDPKAVVHPDLIPQVEGAPLDLLMCGHVIDGEFVNAGYFVREHPPKV